MMSRKKSFLDSLSPLRGSVGTVSLRLVAGLVIALSGPCGAEMVFDNVPARGWGVEYSKEAGVSLFLPKNPLLLSGEDWDNPTYIIYERENAEFFSYVRSILRSSSAGDTINIAWDDQKDAGKVWGRAIVEISIHGQPRGFGWDTEKGVYLLPEKVYRRKNAAWFDTLLTFSTNQWSEVTYTNYILRSNVISMQTYREYRFDQDTAPYWLPSFEVPGTLEEGTVPFAFPLVPRTKLFFGTTGEVDGLDFGFSNQARRALIRSGGKGLELRFSSISPSGKEYLVFQSENPTHYSLLAEIFGMCSRPGSVNDFEVLDNPYRNSFKVMLGTVGTNFLPTSPVGSDSVIFSEDWGAGLVAQKSIMGEVARAKGGAIDFWITPLFDPNEPGISVTFFDSLCDGSKIEDRVSVGWDGNLGLCVSTYNKEKICIPVSKVNLVRNQKTHIAIAWGADGLPFSFGKTRIFKDGRLLGVENLDIKKLVISGPLSLSNDVASRMADYNKNWAFWVASGRAVPRMLYVEKNMRYTEGSIGRYPFSEVKYLGANMDGGPIWEEHSYFLGQMGSGEVSGNVSKYLVHFPYKLAYALPRNIVDGQGVLHDFATWDEVPNSLLGWAKDVRADDSEYLARDDSQFEEVMSVGITRGLVLNPGSSSIFLFHSLRVYDQPQLDFSQPISTLTNINRIGAYQFNLSDLAPSQPYANLAGADPAEVFRGPGGTDEIPSWIPQARFNSAWATGWIGVVNVSPQVLALDADSTCNGNKIFRFLFDSGIETGP